MLHHYGKVLPKIYASPIKPRSEMLGKNSEKTYLSYIYNDFEQSLPTNLQLVDFPRSKSVVEVPKEGMMSF